MVSYVGNDVDSYSGIETETYFCNGNKGDYYITKEWQMIDNTPICCTVMVNVADDRIHSQEKINKASDYITSFAYKCYSDGEIASMPICSEIDLYSDADCVEATVYTCEDDTKAVFDAFCNYFGED